MLKGKNLWGAAAAAMLVGSGLSIPLAQAAYTVSLVEQGTSVVATGSGTIDTIDLTAGYTAPGAPSMYAFAGEITTGPTSYPDNIFQEYHGPYTGPASFGGGGLSYAGSGSGDTVGIIAELNSNELFVPRGYVSGASLSSSATWGNTDFTSLAVTPGTYEWTWGSGADADSFTLQIGAASDVPEPTSLLLLTTGMLALGVFRRKRTVPKFAV
jgi:hypothetical protein